MKSINKTTSGKYVASLIIPDEDGGTIKGTRKVSIGTFSSKKQAELAMEVAEESYNELGAEYIQNIYANRMCTP